MRARGEGHLAERPRKDGRWPARYHDAAGLPHWVYGRTREEAREKLADAIRDRDRGLPVASRKYTLASWLPEWLESIPPRAIRASSRQRYEWACNRWKAEPIARRYKLVELTPARVAVALGHMGETGLAPRSQGYVLSVLRLALDEAMRSEHVGRNVARQVKPPQHQGPRSAGAPPRGEELLALRRAIAVDELEALWVLLLDAGLRIGEALALQYRHIDFVAGIVRVEGTRAVGGRGIARIGEPKSESSRRPLPVDEPVLEALLRHRARTYPVGVRPFPEAFVFAMPGHGRPRSHSTAERWYRGMLRRHHIRAHRPHDLRHSFGTRWIEAGKPITLLSRYMGHSSISITADTYGHPELVRPGLLSTELVGPTLGGAI